MGDVIEFKGKEQSLSGDAICASCKHVWVAVAPVGASILECPSCLTNKGRFANPVAPVLDHIWECQCGGNLFFIGKSEAQCYQCGKLQNWGE